MRLLMILAAASLLAGCAVSSVFEASPEEIAAKVYVPEGPPKLTVFTMVNNNTGSGGHTSLMVSGSQQVIYDPAGSFLHADVAERGDVLYGMSPAWVQGYKSAHARSTYHVVSQEIVVTPAQAERALQLVQTKGAVPGAFCANATSAILKEIPGFENISVTFFPINLMEQIAQHLDVVQIAQRPDVKTDKYYENDEGDVRDGIEAAQS